MDSLLQVHPLIQAVQEAPGRRRFINATDCDLRADPRFSNICGVAILPEHRYTYGADHSWEEAEATDAYGCRKPILFVRFEETP